VVEVVLHEVGQPVGERGGLRGRGGQARNVVLFIGDGMGATQRHNNVRARRPPPQPCVVGAGCRPRSMLGGMATYIGEGLLSLRVKDVVDWLQRFPDEALVYASREPLAIVVRDKDNLRHLSSLRAPEPPAPS
jgi:hypothetical protein